MQPSAGTWLIQTAISSTLGLAVMPHSQESSLVVIFCAYDSSHM